MTLTLPAGMDPARATLSLDYDMAGAIPVPANSSALPWDSGLGTIRIWTKNGIDRRDGGFVTDNPQNCGDLIPSGYTLKASDFGYTGDSLTLTLYVEGVGQANYIHTYANVLSHGRPTQPITVKCYPTGGAGGLTLTDTVQYIVADPTSFYWLLQTHEELRASFASDGIYTRADLPKYCLQQMSFEQLCSSTGGFGLNEVDTASIFSLGAGVYHDYISGKNLLTFKGTDNMDGWFNNIEQAVNPPAPQYTQAMTIATHLRENWDDPFRPQSAVYTPAMPSGWFIAGHSLGGGLAAAASVISGFRADTYNAAGVNYVTVMQFCQAHPNLGLNITSQAQLSGRAAGLVTSYVVNGELLNCAQDGWLAIELGFPALYFADLPVSIGTRVTLDSGCTILPSLAGEYTRYTLHSYYIESLLLSYEFPLQ